MGDVIFAPLYHALRQARRALPLLPPRHRPRRQRGRASDRRGRRRSSRRRCATSEYEPLVHGRGRAPAGRAAPLWDQLERGRAAACERRRPRARRRPARPRLDGGCAAARTSTPSCSASPAGALEPLCGELAAANARFAAMLGGGAHRRHAVAADLARRGWRSRSASAPRAASPAGCAKPFDTCCDMTHLVAREAWPPGSDLRRLAYLCGMLPRRPGGAGARRRCARARDALARRPTARGRARRWSASTAAPAARSTTSSGAPTRAGSERYVLTPGGQHQAPAGARRLGLREPRAGRRLDAHAGQRRQRRGGGAVRSQRPPPR